MQDPGHMNDKETREALLRAVAGRDISAQLPVVARTRRAIRVANETRREQGERGRHNIGVTLFVLGAIFVVLAPAMWGSLDDFFGGEHFGDLPTQITLLSTFLMLAIVGALVVVWRNRAANQDEYRQDH
jgi:protein-S-isoprenylcysteine O-methyltransferase Ste14